MFNVLCDSRCNAQARFWGSRVIKPRTALRISLVDFHIWVFPVNWTRPLELPFLLEPRFHVFGCLHTKDDFLLLSPELGEISGVGGVGGFLARTPLLNA